MSGSNPSVGDWTAVRLLESGAGGEVWEAHGPSGEAILKFARSDDSRIALARELEVLRRLEHPQVAHLIEADPDSEWMIRSFVKGKDLRYWGRDKPISSTVDLCASLSEVLAHLHENGVVHADLKPANVVVDAQDTPHLIDLGCAFLTGEEVKGGAFRGTLGHAAPEQLQGRTPQPQTDFYSLATVTYALLTGRPPFVSNDPAALAYLPLANLPAPASTYRLEVEPHLDEAILSLLVRDPERRPCNGHEVAAMLRRSLYERGLPQSLGQPRARQNLRQLVAQAARGQTGAAVIYGPEGSGRQTLALEAVRCAHREGIESITMQEDQLELPCALDDSASMRVVVTPLVGRSTVEMAREILQNKLPFLLLICSRRPLMELGTLGARHISPEPLEVRHVATLLERHGQDPARAAIVHRRARGLPGRIRSQLMVPELRTDPLTEKESKLLEATIGRKVPLTALSEIMGLSHHALVDLAEPLVDRGLLQVCNGGRALEASESRTPPGTHPEASR